MTEDGKFGKETGRSTQGDSARTGGIAPGGQYQVTQPPPPGWYPPAEDEIDLADLVGVLYRRKWLIAGVTILFACLAFAAASVMTEKYEAKSIIEVGQIQAENNYRYIEAPNAVADRLEGIANRVSSTAPFDEGMQFSVSGDLSISPSEKGGIIEVSLEAPKNSKAIQFLSQLHQHLVKDHARIIEVEQQSFKTRINNLENTINEWKGKKNSYQKRLKNLKQEEEFLKEQIRSVNQQVNQILAIKAKANLNPAKEPLGQLLFSNEMHRIQAHKDQLSSRLISEIPEEHENLLMEIHSADAKIQTLKNDLEMMRTRLENFITTSVLLSPQFSKNSVSPNLKLIVALGLVLGFFLSVFLAFITEFWQHNKERIKGGQETAGGQSQG